MNAHEALAIHLECRLHRRLGWRVWVAEYLFRTLPHWLVTVFMQNPSQSQITQHSQDFFHMQRIESELKWDLNTLRDYVSFVRDRPTPALTIAAEILLQRYYQQRRQEVDRQGSRTTVRLLESLMRLSIAHARLMMHHRVEPTDAVAAIHCHHAKLARNSQILP